MVVISDTSALVNLAAIDYLFLLPQLFGRVVIPQAVFDEIVVRGAGKPGAEEVASATWIEVRTCQDQTLLNRFLSVLNRGEAEAIALALEINADLLIIDEDAGRTEARKAGLPITGLLGVLLRAKARGLIHHVKPELDALRSKALFWISEPLYREVIRLAGENES